MCVACGEYLRSQDAAGAEGGISGGYCEQCLAALLGENVIVDADLPPDAPTFVEGMVLTFAIILAFMGFGILGAWAWMEVALR